MFIIFNVEISLVFANLKFNIFDIFFLLSKFLLLKIFLIFSSIFFLLSQTKPRLLDISPQEILLLNGTKLKTGILFTAAWKAVVLPFCMTSFAEINSLLKFPEFLIIKFFLFFNLFFQINNFSFGCGLTINI